LLAFAFDRSLFALIKKGVAMRAIAMLALIPFLDPHRPACTGTGSEDARPNLVWLSRGTRTFAPSEILTGPRRRWPSRPRWTPSPARAGTVNLNCDAGHSIYGFQNIIGPASPGF